MRRAFIIGFMLFASLRMNGQVVLLDKVYEFIEKKELQKAEEALLIAEKNVATTNDARTYYLKAYVYKEMFVQAKDDGRKKYRNACRASLARCQALDVDGSFKTQLKQLNDYIQATVFNEASDAFNSEQFSLAIILFNEYVTYSSLRDQTWLDANFFIGSAHYSLNQPDSAIQYYQQLIDRNYDQPAIFVDLGYIYQQKNKPDTALLILQQGLQRYPSFYDMEVAELNVLMEMKKFDVLEQRVDKFLAAYPENIEAMMMAATTYMMNSNETSRMNAFNKSVGMYEKILLANPYHYDANYNLGVLYYNEAVDIVNKSSFDTDIDQLSIILEKSTALFEKALPLLLRIHDSKKNDQKLLHALQAIYYNLNMKDKLAEVNEVIRNLNAK